MYYLKKVIFYYFFNSIEIQPDKSNFLLRTLKKKEEELKQSPLKRNNKEVDGLEENKTKKVKETSD